MLWSTLWILGRHSNLFLEIVPLLCQGHLSLNAQKVFLFRSVFLFFLFLLTQIFIALPFTCCILTHCFSVLMSYWNWLLTSINLIYLVLGWLGNFVGGNYRFRTNLYVLGERGLQSQFFVGRTHHWARFIARLPIYFALIIVLNWVLNFPFLNFKSLIWHAEVWGTHCLDLLLVVARICGLSNALSCQYNLMHWSRRGTCHGLCCTHTWRSFLRHRCTLFLSCHNLG